MSKRWGSLKPDEICVNMKQHAGRIDVGVASRGWKSLIIRLELFKGAQFHFFQDNAIQGAKACPPADWTSVWNDFEHLSNPESRMTIDNEKVIEFPSADNLLAKAEAFLNDLELFLEQREAAVPLLLKAIRYASGEMRHKIILLLGGFAKQEVAEPLYRLMTDPQEEDDLRRDASIHLSVIFPFLKDPQPLIDRLLDRLRHSDPEVRENAAFALGWEGNTRAAIPLIELLFDTDSGVQQTAVNALSNLGDDRLLHLLIDRLEHGPFEQKRAILFNIWRFHSRKNEVSQIYREHLTHENDDLRFDALVLLGTINEAADIVPECRRCLKDSNPRIRELAVKKISEAGPENLDRFRTEIELLLADPNGSVKQAATQALKIKRPPGRPNRRSIPSAAK